MNQLEHTHIDDGKFHDGCQRCSLQASADKAAKLLADAAKASKKAGAAGDPKRQRVLYDAAPKWGDAA